MVYSLVGRSRLLIAVAVTLAVAFVPLVLAGITVRSNASVNQRDNSTALGAEVIGSQVGYTFVMLVFVTLVLGAGALALRAWHWSVKT
ncbi:MAG: hypothetical protein M3Q98_02915 [Actinomycetota bacterium]|nr:hypothetical protein [Actinomycetota bacterium]